MVKTSSDLASRWKLISIPLLAGVLLYLFIPVEAPHPNELPSEPQGAVQAASRSSLTHDHQPVHTGPVPSLPDLLAANPFAPLHKPSQETTTQAATSNAVQSDGLPAAHAPPEIRVSAIYHSSSGPVAIVDNRRVRVGDLLTPHFRVTGIREGGIEISAAE